jgi:hypothetical protein
MLAAYNNSNVVNKYLKEELEYSCLVKVQSPLAGFVHVSKLGVIPKKHQPMEIRLPAEKLSRIRQMILSWRSKNSCTKRHLLSLIGNLQHASSVVRPGRTFLRRMIDLSKRQVHMDSHLRLNAEFRADVQWWATFLDAWNCVSVISTLCRRPVDARLVSDASGSRGCGAT